MNKIDNLDELVDKITQKVAERLAQMNMQPSKTTSSHCQNSADSCTNCNMCVERNTPNVHKIVDIGATRIGSTVGIKAGNIDRSLAAMIDHTLLKPDATREELTKVCDEARQFQFATVCVNASNIPLVARLLKGSAVKPIAVVGFPLGAASTSSKVFETKEAVSNGAQEIDMVINIGALKSKDYRYVSEDIIKVV